MAEDVVKMAEKIISRMTGDPLENRSLVVDLILQAQENCIERAKSHLAPITIRIDVEMAEKALEGIRKKRFWHGKK